MVEVVEVVQAKLHESMLRICFNRIKVLVVRDRCNIFLS